MSDAHVYKQPRMKFWLLIAIIIVLAAALGYTVTTHAADFRSNDNVTVESDEVVADDLFVAGKNVRIDGEVQGDVYAAGELITINGLVGGDLIVAGSTITVNGTVDGSVRAAGQTLNLSGSDVGGGVSFFGATLVSEPGSSIGNGLLFFGDSADINSSIEHGVTAYGSNVTINNSVGTDSNINAEQFTIGDNATMLGDVEYRSDQDANVSGDANVAGDVTRVGDLERMNVDWQVNFYGFLLWSYLAALMVGGVLLLLARRPVEATADAVRTRPLASFGVGILAMFVVVPLGFVFMITVVGIPLAILLWLAFAVALYLSKFFVGIALGKAILTSLAGQKTPRLIYSFLVGLTALYLLNMVPLITVLVSLVIGSLGLGALILRSATGVRGQYANPTKK